MFIYPRINPIAFNIGPLKVHWYGIMYLIGFLMAWGLANYRTKQHRLNWSGAELSDLLFYCAFGAILGGRIGYMLFYDIHNFIYSPWMVFKIWQGGMSFHGGFIGVLIAVYLWGRKNNRSFFEITDFITPFVPIGLGAGRVGNFINGELWGRITNIPWGMIYPQVGLSPRHPSEIYEFFLEGILLFVLLWWFTNKSKPRMATSGLFLLGYGVVRFICEFFRQPDSQLGFVAFNWLTMGQLLSLPMIFIGAYLLWFVYKRKNSEAIS